MYIVSPDIPLDKKLFKPMLFTLLGMTIEANAELANAYSPILFNEESASNVTEVNAVAFWNVLSPIVVTCSGMIIEVNPDW